MINGRERRESKRCRGCKLSSVCCSMPEANAPEKMRAVYGFYHSGAQYLKIIRMKDFKEQLEVFKFARIVEKLLGKGVGEEEFVRMGEKLYFTVSRHALSWKKR